MKKKQTFGDAYSGWVEAHRPKLFHPGKSWTKYLALKAAGLGARGIAGAVRETYYALTPEKLPDPRSETTEELWHAVHELPPIEIDDLVKDLLEKVPNKLSTYSSITRALLAPDLAPPHLDDYPDAIAQARWRDQARRFIATY